MIELRNGVGLIDWLWINCEALKLDKEIFVLISNPILAHLPKPHIALNQYLQLSPKSLKFTLISFSPWAILLSYYYSLKQNLQFAQYLILLFI